MSNSAAKSSKGSLKIEPSGQLKLSDIERNGRCFSDGCGTISWALLQEICSKYPRLQMKAKPVLLQIRFMGKLKPLVNLYYSRISKPRYSPADDPRGNAP